MNDIDHFKNIRARARNHNSHKLTAENIATGTLMAHADLVAHGISPETAAHYLSLPRRKRTGNDRRYTVMHLINNDVVKRWHQDYMAGKSLESISRNNPFPISTSRIRQSFDDHALSTTGRAGQYSDADLREWHEYYTKHKVTIAWIAEHKALNHLTKSTISNRWRKLGLTSRISSDPDHIYTCEVCGAQYERFHSFVGHSNAHRDVRKLKGVS